MLFPPVLAARVRQAVARLPVATATIAFAWFMSPVCSAP
jgi:hypothetical protein